jgi:hypothetical protein
VGLAGAALPAVGDLCATCIGDSVTVERRAAAFAWLDMGQALGAALGIALGGAYGNWATLGAIPVLAFAAFGALELHDRGTPRSSWPLGAYRATLGTPMGWQLTFTAFLCGLLAGPGLAIGMRLQGGAHLLPALPRWLVALLPLAGMALAARIEPRMPNAMWLPRGAAVVAVAGRFLGSPPLFAVAMGIICGAIPAAVARGVGEMERPIASSLAWSALFLGAAAGAVL